MIGLPQSISYKVHTPINQLHGDFTVAELIGGATCRWKTNLVEEVFNSEEEKIICNIPLNIRDISDRLIWVRNAKGIFSVKSAHLLDCVLSKQTQGESSNKEVIELVWRQLLLLQVPEKLK